MAVRGPASVADYWSWQPGVLVVVRAFGQRLPDVGSSAIAMPEHVAGMPDAVHKAKGALGSSRGTAGIHTSAREFAAIAHKDSGHADRVFEKPRMPASSTGEYGR